MAIKKLLVALFLFTLLTTILVAVFGPSGILANRSLAMRLEALERLEEERRLEVEALQRQVADTSSEERLNDIALSLGYNRRGDVVYYFQDEDVVESGTSSSSAAADTELYEGIPTWILALIALGVTLAISLAAALVQHLMQSPLDRERKDKERARAEYESYDW